MYLTAAVAGSTFAAGSPGRPPGSPNPQDKTFGPFRFVGTPVVYYRKTGTFTIYLRTNHTLPRLRPKNDATAGYLTMNGAFLDGYSFEHEVRGRPCYEYVGADVPAEHALRHPHPGLPVSLTLVIYRTPKAVVHIRAVAQPEPPLGSGRPPDVRRICGV